MAKVFIGVDPHKLSATIEVVDERETVQLERLYHEASAVLPTTYLEVPRRGPRGRFLPIKTPADLDRMQDELRELLASPPI